MQRFGIGAQELKMARLLWKREGIGSGAVVKLCAEEMGWKKSTTYTMLRWFYSGSCFSCEEVPGDFCKGKERAFRTFKVRHRSLGGV